MSQLRSVLDELAKDPEERWSASDLDAELVELLDCRQRLDVIIADRVDQLRADSRLVELGYPNPTAYLTHRGRMSGSSAKRMVTLANARVRATGTHAAWADGRLSTDQTHKVLALAESVPDQFPEAEDWLVEIVGSLSVRDAARALEYWRQSVDGLGELDIDIQLGRRGISLSASMDGMRRIDGWLTQLAGQALETALDAVMPPPTEDDTRTPRQRRHDALEDLARGWLEHADTPTVGREKPQLMLLTDLDALGGVAGGLHESIDGDVVDVEMLRMIACDCSLTRIVLGPEGGILDVGRKSRVWTSGQRRAITVRDRHCTAEGCQRSARHCDIHHRTHWADGGHTSVDQGRLLCRFHHTLEHLSLARARRRT